MAEAVTIVGVGMMTSVGLSAEETAASVRAGTSRFTQIEWRDHRFERFTVAEVIEDGLPDLAEELVAETSLTWREERLLRLAQMPLLEAVKPLSPTGRRPGLMLALPDTQTQLPLDAGLFLKRLALQTKGAFDLAASEATTKGRAGGLLALGRAAEKIRAGQAEFVLAGGVDCYVDLYVLATLDLGERIKSSKHLDGFIPGEGAGFVLLAGRRAAEKIGLAILAVVAPMAEGFEEGHLGSEKPYQGAGLAGAFQKFLSGAELKEPIREVYSSMNGESHWAKEWGVAFLRNKTAFEPVHGMHHPADSFGDTGAACGPLLTGLAVQGVVKRYRHSPCLIYGSSDGGQRAVMGLRLP
jgi:3-oxoacyl-[acyl-carrier-protein] synthase I